MDQSEGTKMATSLQRLKLEFPECINDCVNDGIPKEMLTSTTATFIDLDPAGGQLLKLLNNALHKYGYDEQNIKERVYALFGSRLDMNYAIRTHGLIGNFAVGTQFEKGLFNNMKFDYIIGNPPYNKGILEKTEENEEFHKHTYGYPHLAFVNLADEMIKNDGTISMLMPASFMTYISCDKWRKKYLPEITQIELLDNRNNDIFDIEHAWIVYLTIDKAKPKSTSIEYKLNDDKFMVDLEKYKFDDNGSEFTFWPVFKSRRQVNIFDKVMEKSKPIERQIGSKNITPTKNYIGYQIQGVKDKPTLNGMPKDRNGIDIKGPGYMLFDSLNDAKKHQHFMESKLFKFLIDITKCVSKTQPSFIQQIGQFDFDTNDYYQFFGFTKEECEEIDNS